MEATLEHVKQGRFRLTSYFLVVRSAYVECWIWYETKPLDTIVAKLSPTLMFMFPVSISRHLTTYGVA